MGKVFINEETLIGIGNAIREKSGTTDLINTTDMASVILNLSSGGSATWKRVRPTTWEYNTNSYNCSMATLDISEYIGTTDDKGFIISISGANNTSYNSTLVLFYDGATFYQLTGGAGNNFISYNITPTLTNGILSIDFYNNMIILTNNFSTNYKSAWNSTLIYIEE